MTRYRVAQVGCGQRGKVHLDAWLANPDRFEFVALCELDAGKMQQVVRERGISPAFYSDAEKMLAETKPDIFCFATQPHVRLQMVELAVKHKVRGLAFEKPMARSLQEACAITELCRRNGIKAIVSHQQKYLTSLQKAKEIADSGQIGEIVEVRGSSTCTLTDLGTHYMDYMLWANGGHHVKWVVGHAHGTRELNASHPSPDFFLARMEFVNGVRGMLEVGTLAPHYMVNAPRWLDSRLAIIGTHGYAWGDTDGRWGALTKSSAGQVLTGFGPGYDPRKPAAGWLTQEKSAIQIPYQRALADWLDDGSKVHPCNVDLAYHGFEVLSAACLSALDHTRVDLPLQDPARAGDLFERMKAQFREVPPLAKA